MLNLDTHIVVKLLGGGLTQRERELLAHEAISISGIVLWEIAKLHQMGRINLPLTGSAMGAFLKSCHVWLIDSAVAFASTQ